MSDSYQGIASAMPSCAILRPPLGAASPPQRLKAWVGTFVMARLKTCPVTNPVALTCAPDVSDTIRGTSDLCAIPGNKPRGGRYNLAQRFSAGTLGTMNREQ